MITNLYTCHCRAMICKTYEHGCFTVQKQNSDGSCSPVASAATDLQLQKKQEATVLPSTRVSSSRRS